MISRFFIDRPIFASVLSIVITLGGGISLFMLPLALYPPISPPMVQVDCVYPGASAKVVSETVATPIEQKVNGVESMLYMSSQCTNDGAYNLSVTFKHGVDLNMAQVLVQNRVALALPLLPDVLKQTGVNVKKRSPDILMAIAVNSPSGKYDQLFLSNYAVLHVKEVLARLPGVSDVNLLGQRDYSMRVWVDPEKLSARSMTAGDVVSALRQQNAQVATGQIGQPPITKNQAIQIPLTTLGRLSEVEQFENVIVKSTRDGRLTRLKDVARVELGAKNQDISGRVNNRASVSLAVFQLPEANALDTAEVVKAKMAELARDFPDGVGYEIRYDTTPFIRESIGEVFKTLREAVILVAVVVLLFLQNWRSAVIPLVAVPVAIIGTFAVMAALGFSLNNLTLFGLVLAIGIVVDDAIVVVEAVEHHIEHGMAPRAATVRAMDEVSGPVVAIGLVLSAVFVPCAFITGIVGQFFRQFALTIAVSTVISAFNSLTLSPALAALMLKPRGHDKTGEILPKFAYVLFGGWLGWDVLAPRLAADYGSWNSLSQWGPWALPSASAAVGAAVGFVASYPGNWLLARLFGLFNAGFKRATSAYTRAVGGLLRMSALVLVVYGGMLGLTYWGFVTTPAGFIPSQDMGYLLLNVQLPDSASLERTMEVTNRMEGIAHEIPGVKHTQAMSGQSMLLSANGSNFGSMFIILDEFHKRPEPVVDRFFAWSGDVVLSLDQTAAGLRGWLDKPDGAAPQGRVAGAWSSARHWLGRTLVPKKGEVKAWFARHVPPVPPDPKAKGPAAAPLSGDDFAGRFRRLLHGPPKRPAMSGDAVAGQLRRRFQAELPDAEVTVLPPPPVRGVGRAGGFKLMIEDRGDNGPEVLQKETDALTDALKTEKDLVGLTAVFRANVPQLFVDVDRREVMAKDVPLKDLFDTMRIYLGSLYVNDINKFGRTWQVVVQADQRFRSRVEDFRRLKVRNTQGGMVPLATVARVTEKPGPMVLTRYNMYPAAPINGSAAPGVSSGDAINLVQRRADDALPESLAYEWTELAYLELQAGNTAMVVFGFAVVMVFLVLAAQYESWSLPLAVILVVPMCLLSAVAGVRASFQDINIFTQIGFVVLVGLASKNAILIVEFAKARRAEGVSAREAALDACRLRLRPIIMTSMAFILGVLPLILSQGAGAEMRRTLGTTVFSGMLGVTAFGIFLTPVFFSVIDRAGESRVFTWKPVRLAADLTLSILTLGFLRPTVRLMLRRPVATGGPDPEPEPAGDINGADSDAG